MWHPSDSIHQPGHCQGPESINHHVWFTHTCVSAIQPSSETSHRPRFLPSGMLGCHQVPPPHTLIVLHALQSMRLLQGPKPQLWVEEGPASAFRLFHPCTWSYVAFVEHLGWHVCLIWLPDKPFPTPACGLKPLEMGCHEPQPPGLTPTPANEGWRKGKNHI